MANSRMIFVNLPVADLRRSRGFLEALGAVNEPRFTDDTAACMTFDDTIHVMLLTHDKFRQFTPRPIADATSASEVLLCLSSDSRESVDSSVERAVAAGGTADPALPCRTQPQKDSDDPHRPGQPPHPLDSRSAGQNLRLFLAQQGSRYAR